MKRFMKSLLVLLGILLLPVTAAGQAVLKVKSFTDLGPVLAFPVEGVSLTTPLSAVPDILTARGWRQVDSGQPERLVFLKGKLEEISGHDPSFYAAEGEDAFTLMVAHSGERKFINLLRLREYKPFVVGSPLVEGPLRDTLDVPIVRALSAVICAGITDAKEHKRLCPPETAEQVSVVNGHNPLRLRTAEGMIQVKALATDRRGVVILSHFK